MIGVPLFSVGTVVGAQGSFTVTASVPGDADAGGAETVDVTVEEKGYDFTVWAQDLHAGVVADGDEVGEETKTPLAPGATAPLDSAIYNYGSKRVVGLSYAVQLPEHTSVATMPGGCELLEDVPVIAGEDDEVVLKPGEVLLPEFTVKVDDDAPVGIFTGGRSRATPASRARREAELAGDEARTATQAQRKGFTEADGNDNYAYFDAYVGAAPTGEPTTRRVADHPASRRGWRRRWWPARHRTADGADRRRRRGHPGRGPGSAAGHRRRRRFIAE